MVSAYVRVCAYVPSAHLPFSVLSYFVALSIVIFIVFLVFCCVAGNTLFLSLLFS